MPERGGGLSALAPPLSSTNSTCVGVLPMFLLHEDDHRRYLTQQALVDQVIGPGSLRPGCDRDHAVATFFATVNSHCYQLLARQLGWSPADWQWWLTDVLGRELLGT